ncbi:MAG: hypothetical protein ACXWHB_17710, partial [Usitatibacter sp.]
AIVFFPGDWLGDTALRLVSVPARGLWIEMLCYMKQSERPGYLTVNGEPLLSEELARIVGAPHEDVQRWLTELRKHRVFDEREGFIVSRRLAREAVKPAAPEPAAEPETSEEMPKGIPPVPYDVIVDAYHKALPQLAKVQRLTPARKSAVRARWRDAWAGKGKEKGWQTVDDGVAHFAKFFAYVAKNCSFLLGEGQGEREGQRPFKADFEWLMKEGNYTKTCEGRYA